MFATPYASVLVFQNVHLKPYSYYLRVRAKEAAETHTEETYTEETYTEETSLV